ncbi:MAG: sigma-54-dependent transcriptional regulator [Candidatus Binatia bacterium]
MPERATASPREDVRSVVSVLVIDDERMMQTMLAGELPRFGFRVTAAGSGEEGLARAAEEEFAVAIVDMLMPGLDGLETLERLRQESPATEVVLLTGHGTIEGAVAAMRAGAYDYLTKPVRLAELSAVLGRAVERWRLRRENAALKLLIAGRGESGQLIAASSAMKAVVALVERAAPSDSPVLIQGESGTGKELVARAIHQLSRRKDRPFVEFNCSAVQDTLVESELFGHQRGAFTGAIERRLGLMEAADGGTIFLDEIAEMSAAVQSKILRALQSGEIRRVGETRTTRVDVRVVAATNKDLGALAESGGFREDLYYRLNTLVVHLPALRERPEDVEPLTRHFLATLSAPGRRVTEISSEAIEALKAHHWRGNVRELKNCVESMLILSSGTRLGLQDLPASVRGERRASKATGPADGPLRPLDEVVGEYLQHAVERCGGNKSLAARSVGIDLKTLTSRLRRGGRRS